MTFVGRHTGRRAISALKAIALLVVLALVVRAFWHADLGAAINHLGHLGPFALLIFVPYPIGILADSAAWSILMGQVARSSTARAAATSRATSRATSLATSLATSPATSLARIFHVRLATEAVAIVLPAGGLIAEVLGPCLLAPSPPIATSLASTTAKRWLILRSHGLFVLIATALSFATLQHYAPILLVCGLALIGASVLLERGVSRTGIATRISSALERLRRFRFFPSIHLDRADSELVDQHLRELGERSHLLPLALLVVQWMLEGVGSYIILRLLGVDTIALHHVLAIDAALTVLRGAAVFAPAGLGVQDLGYLALFPMFGVAHVESIGPAFLLLKRSREVFFVLLGFLALVLAQSKTRAIAPPDPLR